MHKDLLCKTGPGQLDARTRGRGKVDFHERAGEKGTGVISGRSGAGAAKNLINAFTTKSLMPNYHLLKTKTKMPTKEEIKTYVHAGVQRAASPGGHDAGAAGAINDLLDLKEVKLAIAKFAKYAQAASYRESPKNFSPRRSSRKVGDKQPTTIE